MGYKGYRSGLSGTEEERHTRRSSSSAISAAGYKTLDTTEVGAPRYRTRAGSGFSVEEQLLAPEAQNALATLPCNTRYDYDRQAMHGSLCLSMASAA